MSIKGTFVMNVINELYRLYYQNKSRDKIQLEVARQLALIYYPKVKAKIYPLTEEDITTDIFFIIDKALSTYSLKNKVSFESYLHICVSRKIVSNIRFWSKRLSSTESDYDLEDLEKEDLQEDYDKVLDRVMIDLFFQKTKEEFPYLERMVAHEKSLIGLAKIEGQYLEKYKRHMDRNKQKVEEFWEEVYGH